MDALKIASYALMILGLTFLLALIDVLILNGLIFKSSMDDLSSVSFGIVGLVCFLFGFAVLKKSNHLAKEEKNKPKI